MISYSYNYIYKHFPIQYIYFLFAYNSGVCLQLYYVATYVVTCFSMEWFRTFQVGRFTHSNIWKTALIYQTKSCLFCEQIHGTGPLPPSFLATCVYCGLFWDLRLKWVDVSRSFMAVWGKCLVLFARFFFFGGGLKFGGFHQLPLQWKVGDMGHNKQRQGWGVNWTL